MQHFLAYEKYKDEAFALTRRRCTDAAFFALTCRRCKDAAFALTHQGCKIYIIFD